MGAKITTPEEFSPEEKAVVATLLDKAKKKQRPIINVKLTKNQLRGAIRRGKRQARRKAFKGSDGFEASQRFTRKSSGPSAKAAARQRAREFNTTYGGESGSGTDSGTGQQPGL